MPRVRERMHLGVGAIHYPAAEGGDRDALAAALKAQGIPTAIYYPKSLHQQTAYRDFPVADGGLPVSEQLSADVISLPMHAYLDEPTQDRIIEAVRGALSACPERWHPVFGQIMANSISDFAVLKRRCCCRSGGCSDVFSPSAAIRCFRG